MLVFITLRILGLACTWNMKKKASVVSNNGTNELTAIFCDANICYIAMLIFVKNHELFKFGQAKNRVAN